jgi:hypothetical protein
LSKTTSTVSSISLEAGENRLEISRPVRPMAPAGPRTRWQRAGRSQDWDLDARPMLSRIQR